MPRLKVYGLHIPRPGELRLKEAIAAETLSGETCKVSLGQVAHGAVAGRAPSVASGSGMRDEYRAIAWDHGVIAVQRLGAMMGPVTFVVGGRQISPMHVAPWAGEPGTEALPGILRRLRGEWPCVPFGYTVPVDGFAGRWRPSFGPAAADEEPHGASSNREWTWEDAPEGELRLALPYDAERDVARVERRIVPDPTGPAVDVVLTVHVRRDCRLPIGLHPCLRLPARPGAARLEPAPFDHGLTYPGTVEPAAPLFAVDQRFDDLASVPTRDGTKIDATRIPLPVDTEELLQLNGIDGGIALLNEDEGYRVRLSWQKEHFPSLLLWYSNRGRKTEPWNGRHVAVGVEPICSPFGLGLATALADNPVAQSGTSTAFAFEAARPFVTRYRISAETV